MIDLFNTATIFRRLLLYIVGLEQVFKLIFRVISILLMKLIGVAMKGWAGLTYFCKLWRDRTYLKVDAS